MNWIKTHKIWSVIIAIIILGVIGSTGSSPRKTTNLSKTTTNTSPQNRTPSQSQSAAKQSTQAMIFDVASLVGKNIDQIREILGSPKDGAQTEPTAQQKELGTTQWDNQWDKDNVNLLVTFDPNTRKVIDFFVAFDDHDLTAAQQPDILAAGNLKQNASSYTIKFVKEQKDPSKYTGVTATPL